MSGPGATRISGDSRVAIIPMISTFPQAAASPLGKVQLIKEEDQGRTWYLENVLVPDFLVVLRDGRRLLVEVKSHFQEPPTEDFTISPGALDGLQRYASLVGAQLYFAVYL